MNASYSHVRGVVDTVHAGGFVMTRTVDLARIGARCDITGGLGSIADQRRLRGYEEEEDES